MALVLCTGIDPALMATRKLILERAGHSVVPAMSDKEAEAACEQHAFDVAILGQTVTPRLKQDLASKVRSYCPGVKILELYLPHLGRQLADADSWLEVPAAVPEKLAETVTELAGGETKPSQS